MIDMNKKYTYNGKPARVVCTDRVSVWTTVCLVTDHEDGSECVLCLSDTEAEQRLREVTPWEPGKWYWCVDRVCKAFIYATDGRGKNPIHGKRSDPVLDTEVANEWGPKGGFASDEQSPFALTTEEAPAP